MSISPSPIRSELIRDGLYCLARFERTHAGLVASWVPTPADLFWLAPKTFPPLTAAKVLAWPGEEGSPLMFCRDEEVDPLGYVELNPMPGERKHMWMGHCVIDRLRRGQGLGRTMLELLLRYAFDDRRAERVSLVVFPDNVDAIACYRSCGFLDVGTQTKFFYPTGHQHKMLQMSIDAKQWRAIHRV